MGILTMEGMIDWFILWMNSLFCAKKQKKAFPYYLESNSSQTHSSSSIGSRSNGSDIFVLLLISFTQCNVISLVSSATNQEDSSVE